MATPETFREASLDDARSSGRHFELLPNADRDGRRRSDQRQYQGAAATRSRVQEPSLPAPEGSAHGSYPDRIRHHQESSLNCCRLLILAQSLIIMPKRRVRTITFDIGEQIWKP